MDAFVVFAHLVALMVPGVVAASHYYFVASIYFPAVYSWKYLLSGPSICFIPRHMDAGKIEPSHRIDYREATYLLYLTDVGNARIG